jgi:hypothetical protein
VLALIGPGHVCCIVIVADAAQAIVLHDPARAPFRGWSATSSIAAVTKRSMDGYISPHDHRRRAARAASPGRRDGRIVLRGLLRAACSGEQASSMGERAD